MLADCVLYLQPMKLGKFKFLLFSVGLILMASCSESPEKARINQDIEQSKLMLKDKKRVVNELEQKRLDLMKQLADNELEIKELTESRSDLGGALNQLKSEKDVAEDALRDSKNPKFLRSQSEREHDIAEKSSRLHRLETNINETVSEQIEVKQKMQEIAARRFTVKSSLDEVETRLNTNRNDVPMLEKRIAQLEEELEKQ